MRDQRFFRFLTPSVRFYFGIASICSAPLHTSTIMMLRDDRFLRHGAKLREGIVEDIANICNYTRLT